MGNKRWEGFWMWPLIQGFVFFFRGRCACVYFSHSLCSHTFFCLFIWWWCLCFCDLSHVRSNDGMLRGGQRSFSFSFPVSSFGVCFFYTWPQFPTNHSLSLPRPFLLFITHPNVEMHGHHCDEDWEMPKIQIQFCWIFFIFLFQEATMYDSLIPLHFLPQHKY